jgi:ferric-dicitrate binding protein FerR (iron transport regulator)
MNEEQYISPMGSPGKKALSEDKLMAYLEGRLMPEEQHEVEQWLADEGMESDAVDGLAALNTTERRDSVNKLNHSLRRKLHHKKNRKNKAKTELNTIVAIFLILLLVVAGYLYIRFAL